MRGTSDLSTNIRSILITSITKVRLGHFYQHFSQSQHSQPLTGTLATWQRGEWGATPAQDSWWSLSLGGNYSKMTDSGGNWGTRTLVRYSLSTSRSSTVSEGRDKQFVIKNKIISNKMNLIVTTRWRPPMFSRWGTWKEWGPTTNSGNSTLRRMRRVWGNCLDF